MNVPNLRIAYTQESLQYLLASALLDSGVAENQDAEPDDQIATNADPAIDSEDSEDRDQNNPIYVNKPPNPPGSSPFGQIIDLLINNPITWVVSGLTVVLLTWAGLSKNFGTALIKIWNEGVTWRNIVRLFVGPLDKVVTTQLHGLSNSDDPILRACGELFKKEHANVREFIVFTAIENWNSLPVERRKELSEKAVGSVRRGLPREYIEDFARRALVQSNIPTLRDGTRRWLAEKITRRSLSVKEVAKQLAAKQLAVSKQSDADPRFALGQTPKFLRFLARVAINRWVRGLGIDEKAKHIDIWTKFDPRKLPERFIDQFYEFYENSALSIERKYLTRQLGWAILVFFVHCMGMDKFGSFLLARKWRKDIKRLRDIGQPEMAADLEKFVKRSEEDEDAEKAQGTINVAQMKLLHNVALEIVSAPLARVRTQLTEDKGFAKLEVTEPDLLEYLAEMAIREWSTMRYDLEHQRTIAGHLVRFHFSTAQQRMIITDYPALLHPERERDFAIALQEAQNQLPPRFVADFIEWKQAARHYIEVFKHRQRAGISTDPSSAPQSVVRQIKQIWLNMDLEMPTTTNDVYFLFKYLAHAAVYESLQLDPSRTKAVADHVSPDIIRSIINEMIIQRKNELENFRTHVRVYFQALDEEPEIARKGFDAVNKRASFLISIWDSLPAKIQSEFGFSFRQPDLRLFGLPNSFLNLTRVLESLGQNPAQIFSRSEKPWRHDTSQIQDADSPQTSLVMEEIAMINPELRHYPKLLNLGALAFNYHWSRLPKIEKEEMRHRAQRDGYDNLLISIGIPRGYVRFCHDSIYGTRFFTAEAIKQKSGDKNSVGTSGAAGNGGVTPPTAPVATPVAGGQQSTPSGTAETQGAPGGGSATPRSRLSERRSGRFVHGAHAMRSRISHSFARHARIARHGAMMARRAVSL